MVLICSTPVLRIGHAFLDAPVDITLLPRWSLLRRVGNSSAVRLTILIPLIGYLIIFNSYVVHYLELPKEFAGAQPPGSAVSPRLLLIYFGLSALAAGSVIYAYFCP